jgi:hypothetical protein
MWYCICNCGTAFKRNTRAIKHDRPCVKCGQIIGSEKLRNNLSLHRSLKPILNKRLKAIWHKMKDRCYNQNHISYKYYGLKGIGVCQEWKFDFSVFHRWSIDNGYENNLSLDRINGNEGYSPLNCRWATRSEQQNNRKDNRKFQFNNQLLTAREISNITGKSYEYEYHKNRKIKIEAPALR